MFLLRMESLEEISISTNIEANLREAFGRVAWSNKTHEKQADIYHDKYKFLLWVKIILAGSTSAGGIFSVFSECIWARVATAAIATIIFIIDLIFSNCDYANLRDLHQKTATKLWEIREYYVALLCEIHTSSPDLAMIRKLHLEYIELLSKIYENAPRTSSEAYNMATKALHKEELTFTNDEIDKLLPYSLRLKK